jgi:proteasome lid subunit RPN8/RPN11
MLIIPERVYQAIRSHAEQAYPAECCGALLGTPGPGGWRVSTAVQARNASGDGARTAYEITPEELVAIDREARRQRCEIAGFYHSHPDHEAHWSATDLAEAHWVGCGYVITAVCGGRATETRAFLLAGTREEDKLFEEMTIRLEA